jgi:hypothetical protein
MKNRICLAWFCDLDTPERSSGHGRKKFRPAPLNIAPPQEVPVPRQRPKVKQASELRRMFGR